MRLLASLGFLLLLLFSPSLAQYTERACPCTVESIWLDIVAVVDNSASMTTAGLAQVSANLATLIGPLPISQSVGQNSRFSVVTYDSRASIVADLSAYNSVEDAVASIFSTSVSTQQQVNIEDALQRAIDVLTISHTRTNVKTVVILYASAYSSGGFTDPLPVARQIKESGTPIITVAFTQSDTSGEATKLAQLSSPGFAFNSSDANVTGEIQAALCQVNCYCPANYFQYTNDFANPTRKYGECLRYQDIDAAWTPASLACHQTAGGFLYNDWTNAKRAFVNSYVQSQPTYNGNGRWHIGLSYNTTERRYYWEGPYGNKSALGFEQPWCSGYPDPGAYGNVVLMNNGCWQNEQDFRVANRYVCQLNTCDTDTYCS